MAIKRLQNNFTTPEQSKRLLELGVPAWSADCYYLWDETVPKWLNGYKYKRDTKTTLFEDEHIVPCWTACRLMEIYYIARGAYSIEYEYYSSTDMIEDMIRRFEIQKGKIDFSKLEE